MGKLLTERTWNRFGNYPEEYLSYDTGEENAFIAASLYSEQTWRYLVQAEYWL